MDCLDRTNVVQSAIAKWVLSKQLQIIEILGPAERIDDHEGFMHLYRQGLFRSIVYHQTCEVTETSCSSTVWADNADAISMGYSGTGALKTDYTR